MKATEFRLGNWVFGTEGKPNQITTEALKYLIVYGNTPLNQVHPIPITEEILLKCGFEKLKGKIGESYNGKAHLNFGNPVLKINDYTELRTNGGNKYLFLDGLRISCEYLHQLQNLYFALTGQELTYTP